MPQIIQPPPVNSAIGAIRYATKIDTQSANYSGNWVDITDLSITYSPTSTAAKIRVQGLIVVGYDGAVNGTAIRVVRDGNPVGTPTPVGNRTSASGAAFNSNSDTTLPFAIDFVDLPASTASATWKVQFFVNQSGGSSYINRSRNDTDAAYSTRTISTFYLTEFQ